MTSDPFAEHNAFMRAWAARFARGEHEEIPAPEPLKWWQGPRMDVPASSGYGAGGSDYRSPKVL